MNEKQQISEAERRFENWWEAEGKHQYETTGIVGTLKAACRIAWMNGAFVARENN